MTARARPAWLTEAWDLLVGSDPGLLRLRLAVRATIAVAMVVGAQMLVAPRVGIPTIVAILLGGMVAMNGSFAASSRAPRDAALTVAGFPVAAGVGVLAACLVAGHRIAGLVVFDVVMVAAVFLRRYGPRGFQYGMMSWLAYFFTTFVGFRVGQFWDVMAVITAATVCVIVSAAVLVPDRPSAAHAAAQRAFEIRVIALADAARDALTGELPADRVRRVLHARAFRVVEAALIVDGHLPQVATGEGRGPVAAAIRHGLLDVELAAEGLSSAAGQLALLGGLPAELHVELLAALDELHRSDLRAASAHVVELARRAAAADDLPTGVARHVRGAVRALQQLLHGLRTYRDRGPTPSTPTDDFTPAVELFLGNLPGTAPSAVATIGSGTSWWSRRSLNTRLCIQVAVAGAVAIAAGDILSGRRYYWAVLACFLALTGTFTTGEIAVKGANRVLGTFAGLFAATITVHLTGTHDSAIIAVVLVCVFLGLYFFRISYAVMAFAITTVIGQLYNVLHEFTDQLLLLRLAETALGAVVGIAVALVVLPVRTEDVRLSAVDAFLVELRTVLDDVRRRLATAVRDSDLLLDARRLDGRLHQLAVVALPAGGQTLVGLSGRRASRRLLPFTEAAYSARALAAAVAHWTTQVAGGASNERADLVRQADAVRDRLVVTRAVDGLDRVMVVLAEARDEMLALRRDVDVAAREAHTVAGDPLLDTLTRAVLGVHDNP